MIFQRASKTLTSFVAICSFAASMLYLANRFQWRDAMSLVRGADFTRLVALVWITQLLYVLIRAWRWRIAIQHAQPDVVFFDLYWITAVVVSLSILTPAQLGEGLKIELLKRRGLLGRLPGLGAFAMERGLDLVIVSAMAVVALIFGPLGRRYSGVRAGAAFIFLLALLGLYLLLRFEPTGRASNWIARLRHGRVSLATWGIMTGLTVLSWVVVGIGWQIALSFVDVHLSLSGALSLVSLVTLGTVLSFVPGGLGVSEVVTSQALVNMGIAPVAAQAGALILRVYALILVLFGIAHLVLWKAFVVASSFVAGTAPADRR